MPRNNRSARKRGICVRYLEGDFPPEGARDKMSMQGTERYMNYAIPVRQYCEMAVTRARHPTLKYP